MAAGPRLRRLAPWLIGLLLLASLPPIAWGVHTYTASDQQVHRGRLIVEATPEGPVGDLPPGPQQREPLYNLTVQRVVEPGAENGRVSPADTIEVRVPAYREEAEGLATQEDALLFALSRSQKHYPENGTVYWEGWQLEDTSRDGLWSPQRTQIGEAIGLLGISVGSASLAGLSLWAYGRAPVRDLRELAGPLAALVLGLLLAGMSANAAGEMNVLFDWHYDGPPAPGPGGLALMALLPFLAAWGARSGPPGARTALLAGLAFPIGIATTVLWLWPAFTPSLLDEFTSWALFTLPLALGGATAARWLPNQRLRRATSLVLAVLLVAGLAWGWPIMVFLAIPIVGVLAPAIAELWGPPTGARFRP